MAAGYLLGGRSAMEKNTFASKKAVDPAIEKGSPALMEATRKQMAETKNMTHPTIWNEKLNMWASLDLSMSLDSPHL
ncbi:MAG: hypothetical protein ACPGO7_00420 [Alphaproteobacteria bacterium]